MAHSAVILRKLGNSWKVLLFLPNSPLPDIEGLLGNFDRLGLDEGPPDAAPKVTLLAPADYARLEIPNYYLIRSDGRAVRTAYKKKLSRRTLRP